MKKIKLVNLGVKIKGFRASRQQVKLVTAILIVVLVAAVGAVILKNKVTDKAIASDCLQKALLATDTLNSRKYEEAYKLLEPNTAACGIVPDEDVISDDSKVDSVAGIAVFNDQLARVHYFRNNHSEAKASAQRAVTIYEKLGDRQDKVPGGVGLLFDMNYILSGSGLSEPVDPNGELDPRI